MILTGKAKEDFLKWVYSEYDYEYEHLKDFYPLHLLDGLIIEWFDSVGIYISINYVSFYDEMKSYKGFESYVTNELLSTKFRALKTRQEATQQAITKAKEIYNESTHTNIGLI